MKGLTDSPSSSNHFKRNDVLYGSAVNLESKVAGENRDPVSEMDMTERLHLWTDTNQLEYVPCPWIAKFDEVLKFRYPHPRTLNGGRVR